MILDTGICTVFRRYDTAEAGCKPVYGYRLLGKSWFKELNFETAPAWETEGRKSLRADARIRILQDRGIRQHDTVVLRDVDTVRDLPAGTPVYRILRAYHGQDDDGPTLISDLTLEVVTP